MAFPKSTTRCIVMGENDKNHAVSNLSDGIIIPSNDCFY